MLTPLGCLHRRLHVRAAGGGDSDYVDVFRLQHLTLVVEILTSILFHQFPCPARAVSTETYDPDINQIHQHPDMKLFG